MAKKPRKPKPNPKQPYHVNPGFWKPGYDDFDPSNKSAEEIEAYNKIADANDKALEDYEKDLIDYTKANKERMSAIEQYARDAGISLKEKQKLLQKSGEELRSKAKELGKPVTLDKSKDQTSDAQGASKLFDELGAGLGRPAYEGARILRYLDTIQKAGGLDGIGSKIGNLGKPPKDPSELTGDHINPKGNFGTPVGGGGGGKPPGGSLAIPGAGGGGGAGGLGKAAGAAGEGAIGAELAELAGPIGAIVALADMAGKKIADDINGYSKAIGQATDATAKLASNEALGALNIAVEGVAESLEDIPIIGQVYAAELRAAIGPLNNFTKLVTAFTDRGKQLAGYNQPLAAASANSDVSKLLADIRESNKLGNDYGELIRAQTAIEVNIQDALIPIKSLILKALIPIARGIERTTDVVASIAERGEAVQESFSRLSDLAGQLANLGPISQLMGAFFKIFNADRDRKKAEANKLAFDQIIELAGKVKIEYDNANPAEQAAAGGIAFPLIGQ